MSLIFKNYINLKKNIKKWKYQKDISFIEIKGGSLNDSFNNNFSLITILSI